MKTDNLEVTTSKDIVLEYILRSVNIQSLDNDHDLFESGLATSLFAIQLMTFIEKSFHIKITTDDLDLNNFRSVNAICAFIESKQQQR